MEKLENNRSWMQTYTGLKFSYTDPKPNQITITDIAYHLSNLNRFNGSTKEQISVAQHSIIVARYVYHETKSKYYALWGLLHDASEAVTGDMVTYFKRTIPELKNREDKYLKMIIEKFGLNWPMPKVVKKWDSIVGDNEAYSFTRSGSPEFYGKEKCQKVMISNMTSRQARETFLRLFSILSIGLIDHQDL